MTGEPLIWGRALLFNRIYGTPLRAQMLFVRVDLDNEVYVFNSVPRHLQV